MRADQGRLLVDHELQERVGGARRGADLAHRDEEQETAHDGGHCQVQGRGTREKGLFVKADDPGNG